ncbi:MAG TPA: hydrogenase maturation nickel metallochaperone HypA [Geobacteraceae bacterium]|jgi:hydrogenase nickel incorporation protein HypA/HybF|nr:hydrogenase maturation nickel metallochaperone HypA [Geobacteraceae bacterium]
MHELSIIQGVVELCEQHSGGRPVLAVTLQIGALSGVVPDALEFCFEAVTKGSLLEGARLEIERIEATGYCSDCGIVSRIDTYFDPCPSCGALSLTLRTGEEMRVKDLEVE